MKYIYKEQDKVLLLYLQIMTFFANQMLLLLVQSVKVNIRSITWYMVL